MYVVRWFRNDNLFLFRFCSGLLSRWAEINRRAVDTSDIECEKWSLQSSISQYRWPKCADNRQKGIRSRRTSDQIQGILGEWRRNALNLLNRLYLSHQFISIIIIFISTVATIRLWTEAIKGDFSGVSNYIPAIVSVWGRTIVAKRLHVHTLSGLVRSHSDESGCQKSHNRQHIFIIQLQYDWRWHLYGWSQGNVQNISTLYTYSAICYVISNYKQIILQSDLYFN